MTSENAATIARFYELIGALGWSVTGSAHFFGILPRTMRRFLERGEMPRAVMMVLELMVERQITPEDVLNAARLKKTDVKFILGGLHDRRVKDDE